MKLTAQQFEQLALEQLDTLYRVARRLTRNAAEAEDLVQETCLKALAARDSFDLQEFGIRPWLLKILQNIHISKTRREGRQPVTVEEEHLDVAGGTQTTTSGLPTDLSAFEGMDDQLVQAVRALPPDYQAVLLMWAVEEMSYKEIAFALDIPIGTVMSRLHRARQRLGQQLRSYAIRDGIIRE